MRVVHAGRGLAAIVVGAALLTAGLAPTTARSAEPVRVERVAGSDRIATAVAVSRAAHPDGAPAAVVARADAFADALSFGPVAASADGPLLLNPRDRLDPRVADELRRLGVDRVVLAGGTAALSAEVERSLAASWEVTRVAGEDRYATAAAAAGLVPDSDTAVVATGRSPADALAFGPLAARGPHPILLVGDRLDAAAREVLSARAPTRVLVAGGTAAVPAAVVAELEALLPDAEVARVAGRDRYETAALAYDAAVRDGASPATTWLADGRGFADALAAGPAVARRGETLLLVDGADVRRADASADRLRRHAALRERVLLLGGTATITGDASWQVPSVVSGPLLPRGGHLLFPDWRMVAFYGHHSASAMGVLGETDPDTAYERLWRQALPYAEHGDRPILPTFELIVTVATAGPGTDGDYSAPSAPADVQRYLDAARRHGVYLLLDIQPGRSDFLTEVRRYDRFLAEPDVGIALDPEWRMGPGQVPAQTVGSVDAREVEAVADHVAGIVRAHHLPQKLVVVHQFQNRMIRDKHLLTQRPELALTIQMDGHGSRSQKLDTYRHVSTDDGRWWNGFKLFYDEDQRMFSPRELLETVRPVPDFVSYQ